jgi:hypothetical protein
VCAKQTVHDRSHPRPTQIIDSDYPDVVAFAAPHVGPTDRDTAAAGEALSGMGL